VEVTDRDRPIALIVPVSATGSPPTVRMPKRPFSSLRAKRNRPAGWRASSTDLLLEERKRRDLAPSLRSVSHTRDNRADESLHLTLIDHRSRSSMASGPSGTPGLRVASELQIRSVSP